MRAINERILNAQQIARFFVLLFSCVCGCIDCARAMTTIVHIPTSNYDGFAAKTFFLAILSSFVAFFFSSLLWLMEHYALYPDIIDELTLDTAPTISVLLTFHVLFFISVWFFFCFCSSLESAFPRYLYLNFFVFCFFYLVCVLTSCRRSTVINQISRSISGSEKSPIK